MTRKRWKRWLVVVLALLVVTTIGGELYARYSLGLGDPPLFVSDPEIEYLYKPSQDCRRFGNTIRYNTYSMRSDDMPARKAPDEKLRVLVLGDSVVNGGNPTDQGALATQLLQDKLSERLDGTAVVCNVSAGSWGPGNLLGYIEKYGLFDSDAVLLVLSSHDAADKRTFEPVVGINSAYPSRKPVLALEEVLFNHLPGYIRWRLSGDDGSAAMREATGFGAKDDLVAIIDYVTQSELPLVILQHPTAYELKDGYDPGYHEIADLADQRQVDRIELAPYLLDAISQGQTVYRDYIHLNDEGQRALLQGLEDALTLAFNWEQD